MKKSMPSIISMAALLAVTLAAPAFADDTNVPGHPRVNEIDQRLENQQQRIDQGVQNGTMTQGQAAKDEAKDEKVSQELAKDEAEHNGHITKAEQARMNHQLNRNSHRIHRQRKHGAADSGAPAAPAQ